MRGKLTQKLKLNLVQFNTALTRCQWHIPTISVTPRIHLNENFMTDFTHRCKAVALDIGEICYFTAERQIQVNSFQIRQ